MWHWLEPLDLCFCFWVVWNNNPNPALRSIVRGVGCSNGALGCHSVCILSYNLVGAPEIGSVFPIKFDYWVSVPDLICFYWPLIGKSDILSLHCLVPEMSRLRLFASCTQAGFVWTRC